MSFNAKDMTQGGQIASMRIRMFVSVQPEPSGQNLTN